MPVRMYLMAMPTRWFADAHHPQLTNARSIESAGRLRILATSCLEYCYARPAARCLPVEFLVPAPAEHSAAHQDWPAASFHRDGLAVTVGRRIRSGKGTGTPLTSAEFHVREVSAQHSTSKAQHSRCRSVSWDGAWADGMPLAASADAAVW